ncbi:MAG TPA: TPM domain-containing protein [Thermoanaerobaculia bacterium]|jgi:uncharacterized membrane protein|nr:TPM domain-containing protein [Thermoanaerobaculia bacterium]
MKSFLSNVDHDRIVSAIAAAEARSSGEIRVHVHHRAVRDPIAAAKKIFEKLGMTRTAQKNGVLIFVAPRSRNFAILGDSGIHDRCGEHFWKSAAAEMTRLFGEGDFTGGIVATIEKLGEALEAHFPRGVKDANELPNQVDES